MQGTNTNAHNDKHPHWRKLVWETTGCANQDIGPNSGDKTKPSSLAYPRPTVLFKYRLDYSD